jgi:hypothetical protein
VLAASTSRYGGRVTCACGTVVEERWYSRVPSVAAALLAVCGVALETECLPLWAVVPLGLGAWAGVHLALVPLRSWRAVRPG